MTMEELIRRGQELGASDLHLVCGHPVKYRVDGELRDLGVVPLPREQCEDYARQLVGNRYQRLAGDGWPEQENRVGELDLALTVGERRIRVNLFRQQGSCSAALRLLPCRIPALEQLELPAGVQEFARWRQGIVLVTGATGSGKSTTLAAVLDQINQTRAAHIITLEDPVEYQYRPDRCVINQRQIGQDTESYATGLRAALREDPDILLIGEMRDQETIEAAITATETGHLVFATLHTNTAADAVDRIVGSFPAERQPQIRMSLSMTLRAVLAQQLVRRRGGGRAAACELMMVNPAIRNLIREGKTHQIFSAILSGAAQGSVTMDNALLRLVRAGRIDAETARAAAIDRDYVTKNT